MATVTPILDKRYAAKDGYPIKIRIIDGNKQRNISVGYRIPEKCWNGSEVIKHPDKDIINGALSAKLDEAKKYIAECRIRNTPVKIELIGTGKTSYSFLKYLQDRAEQYDANEQIIMRRKARRFAKELQMFFNADVFFEDLTADSLRRFEAWLRKRGNANNTIRNKFKFLRSFFEQARKEGRAEGANPFASHHIAKEPVKKEKLSIREIQAIEQTPLQPGPVNDARNLFLFSYFCKGTRFATCVTFQRSQIKGDRLYIQTDKGKKHISIKIHPRLQKIVDQYPDREIVFPYLKEIPADPEEYLRVVDSSNVIVNRNLKTLAALAGIKTNLTFHVARHSLAFHLKETTNSIHVIKDVLGHSDTRTTEIYLKSLGDEILDNEMDKVYGE